MITKYYSSILLLVLSICLLTGCGKTSISTGPEIHVDNPVTGTSVSVALTINTNGEVVLSESYLQDIVNIGIAGIGWVTSIDTVLYEFERSSNSLFILYEDESGNIWQKEYKIGTPFNVTFNDKNRVREIRSDQNGNILVAVEPVGTAPRYSDLRDDIKQLVQRWDRAHKAADGSSWDTSDLGSVLQNSALQEQLSTVNSLRNKNCYWTIDELMTPQIVRFEVNSSNFLLVEVRKNWDMDLYCNGTKSGDEDGYFTMRYDIENINGQWYITYKTIASRQ